MTTDSTSTEFRLPNELLMIIFDLAGAPSLKSSLPKPGRQLCATVSLLSRAWREFGQSRLLGDVYLSLHTRDFGRSLITRLTATLEAQPRLVNFVKRVSLHYEPDMSPFDSSPAGDGSLALQSLLSVCDKLEYLRYQGPFVEFDLSWLGHLQGQSVFLATTNPLFHLRRPKFGARVQV